MGLRYFKDEAIYFLKSNIKSNINKYSENKKWTVDFLNENRFNDIIGISRIKEENISLIETNNPEDDKKNARIIYSKLKYLTPVQAADERLWTYLTHEKFSDYMTKRWSVEAKLENNDEEKIEGFIRERYFLKGGRDRALIRNGISRLWWCGYTAFDEKRENPFELLDILFETQDIMESVMGRAFSRNKDITNTILSTLYDIKLSCGKLPKRDTIRSMMKHFNGVGGALIIDMADKEMLKDSIISLSEKDLTINEKF